MKALKINMKCSKIILKKIDENVKNFQWRCKMQEIKRDRYLEKLINRRENGLIKIVTGIRRCGKSYLLRTLFKNHLLEN